MKKKFLALALAAACLFSGYSELPERIGGVSEAAVEHIDCDHSHEEQHEAAKITATAPAVVTEEVTKTAEAGKTYAAVKNLKAACGNNYIKLTWTKNTAAKTYKLALYQNGKYKVLKSTAGTTLTAKSLKANTSYTLRVLAYNAKGKLIAYSNIKAKTYGTVKNLKASRSNSSIKVTWSKNSSARKYKLSVLQNGTYKTLKTTAGTTATATGLKANTSYTLRVSAYNANSKLLAYQNITAKTYGTIKNLKATRGNNYIKLTWSKMSSAKTYKLALYQNGAYKVLKSTTGTTLTAKSLKANTSYTLRVLAYNANGKLVAYKNITSKTCATINNLKAARGNNYIKLTWDKNSSAKTYKLALYQNGAYKVLKSTTGTTLTAKSLKANTSYTLRVLAYNTKGDLIAYSNITAKTYPNIANLQASAGKYALKLTWSANTSAKNYKVLMLKNGVYKTVDSTTGVNLTVSNLKLNTSYTLRVAAYNSNKKLIAYSNITAKTLANLENLTATPDGVTVALKWTKNSSAKNYKIRSVKDGVLTALATTTSNSHIVEGLKGYTSYTLEVSAYDTNGKRIAYNDVTVKTGRDPNATYVTCSKCNGSGNCQNCINGYVICSDCSSTHKCEDCNGTTIIRCNKCSGAGYICGDCLYTFTDGWYMKICPTCNGKTVLGTCAMCGGTKNLGECTVCGGDGKVDCPNKASGACDRRGLYCAACYGNKYVSCSACDGYGYHRCKDCDYKGEIPCTACTNGYVNCKHDTDNKVECPTCKGYGTLTCTHCTDGVCPTCHGVDEKCNSAFCENGKCAKCHGVGVVEGTPSGSGSGSGNTGSGNTGSGNTGSGSTYTQTCQLCQGTGKCRLCYGLGSCSLCSGRGQVGWGSSAHTCVSCSGSGRCKYCHGNPTCSSCGGKGYHVYTN